MRKDVILKGLGLDFGHKLEAYLLDWSYLFIRVIVASTILLSHGYGKLAGFSQIALHFPDPLGLGSTLSLIFATGAEFFGAILLVLGLFSRWASFSLLFTMMVAFFIFHSADPFKQKELAFLYALFFLFFTVVGGGKYSLDALLKGKIKQS